jgi:hypothetical protein
VLGPAAVVTRVGVVPAAGAAPPAGEEGVVAVDAEGAEDADVAVGAPALAAPDPVSPARSTGAAASPPRS